MVGACAAVLGDAPAELGELQNHGLGQQALIAEIVVERGEAVVQRRHQPGVPPVLTPCPACVSNPPVCTQNTRVPMPRAITPATAFSACANPLFAVRDGRDVRGHRRHAIQCGERRLAPWSSRTPGAAG